MSKYDYLPPAVALKFRMWFEGYEPTKKERKLLNRAPEKRRKNLERKKPNKKAKARERILSA